MLHGMRNPLPVIVIAQLFGGSLWFSTNAAAEALTRAWGLDATDIGTLTNAVQFGFITGTLAFSLSGLADRFTASRIFAVSAVIGALANALFALFAGDLESGLVLRFIVGVSLAGVYPLGMKLVVSWVPERAGSALAWLVGMLTLGTALPHAIRWAGVGLPWQANILASSLLAIVAAQMVLSLGDGPHLRLRHGAPPLRLGQVLYTFSLPTFRASALGYFGHQWEIYAFWTLTPTLVVLAGLAEPASATQSLLAFAIVGIGALSCVLGGRWSHRIGSARVAAVSLAVSAVCCAVYPLSDVLPASLKLALLLVWGAAVVMDSPHFSALSAKACPPEIVGSALAFQTAIGFAITMVSIQLGTHWIGTLGSDVAWLLLPGPILGLIGLAPLWRMRRPAPSPHCGSPAHENTDRPTRR